MKELNDLRGLVEGWQTLAQRARDAVDLVEMGDDSIADDLTTEAAAIQAELDQRELLLMLSGPHDRGNALLSLHAGAGGVDAADWNGMLLRMFLRWAEQRGFKADVVDQVEGDEGGVKNATITIAGEYAYGYLRSERGVHRLVRLSPFDAAHRRHTSFALVEVWPELAEGEEVDHQTAGHQDRYVQIGGGGRPERAEE